MTDMQFPTMKLVQKTTKLGTDKTGVTTYKMNFYDETGALVQNKGVEAYVIEVINDKGIVIKYELYNGEILSNAQVLEYYDGGALLAEKYYLDGRREGPYKLFYPSGALWKEGRFHNDSLVRCKTYAENGKVLNDKIFVEMISVSVNNQEIFYKDGREIACWIKNPDGTIVKTGEIIDGLVRYYENNLLKEEHIYDEGKVVEIKTYNKKGQIVTSKKLADIKSFENKSSL